ncbi:MAG: branched-chain amino acid transport system substrate-binding protein [Thermoleophilaceae bacterium]|jgi:branched-chain amino acid transport system substrate-binding protein|nr:branched-chain amino acid transport system substrate-binding protein [Thermoleophilaceae bacterium]
MQGLKVRSRIAVLTAGVLLGTVGVVGCGGSDEAAQQGSSSEAAAKVENYEIGAALALTGDYAIFDQPMLEGLKVGIDDVNAQGPILGKYKLNLNVEDMRSDVGQAVVTTKELLDRDMDFIFAPCQTDSAIAAGRLAQQAKMPAISTCASSPVLTSSVGDHMFGNYPADNFESAATATYARSKGYETAFVIESSDTAYTENIPKYFAKTFETKGGKIAGRASFSLSQQDFGPLVTRIKNLRPKADVINTGMFEPAFPAFMKQLRAAGVDTPVIATGGIDTPSVAALGDIMDGVVYPVQGFAKPGSKLAEFNEKLTERSGKEAVTNWATVGYDLALIMKEALETAKSAEPAAVRDAIAGMKDFQGIASPITYDYPGANGLPLRNFSLVRLEKGEKVLIEELSLDPADVPKPF